MSIKAMSYIWEHSEQKGSKLLALLAIADRCDDEGVCYPGHNRLAKKARISKQAIAKNIKALEEAGELSVTIHGGIKTTHGNTNKYYLTKYRDSLELVTPDGNRSEYVQYDGVSKRIPQGIYKDIPQEVYESISYPLVDPSVDTSEKALSAKTADAENADGEFEYEGKAITMDVIERLQGIRDGSDGDYDIDTSDSFTYYYRWNVKANKRELTNTGITLLAAYDEMQGANADGIELDTDGRLTEGSWRKIDGLDDKQQPLTDEQAAVLDELSKYPGKVMSYANTVWSEVRGFTYQRQVAHSLDIRWNLTDRGRAALKEYTMQRKVIMCGDCNGSGTVAEWEQADGCPVCGVHPRDKQPATVADLVADGVICPVCTKPIEGNDTSGCGWAGGGKFVGERTLIHSWCVQWLWTLKRAPGDRLEDFDANVSSSQPLEHVNPATIDDSLNEDQNKQLAVAHVYGYVAVSKANREHCELLADKGLLKSKRHSKGKISKYELTPVAEQLCRKPGDDLDKWIKVHTGIKDAREQNKKKAASKPRRKNGKTPPDISTMPEISDIAEQLCEIHFSTNYKQLTDENKLTIVKLSRTYRNQGAETGEQIRAIHDHYRSTDWYENASPFGFTKNMRIPQALAIIAGKAKQGIKQQDKPFIVEEIE